MEKVIKVGMAGFGHSGKIFHAPFLKINEGFLLKKVFERTSEKSREEYPTAEIVRSFEELLTDDIDLVIITTPNQQHFPMAKMALAAGKHVVLEKPMTTTSSQADELCALAKAKKVLLTVYQNRRLDGDFLTVQKLIAAGTLGEILDYEARYERFVSGKNAKAWKAAGGEGVGLLYDLGVHIIDQAYSLFGLPEEIYADFCKQRPESASFDNFAMVLYYPTLKVTLTASEMVLEKGPHYAVHGRKGSFVKYGMDPQEAALNAGQRPGNADWGQDPESCWGILHLKENGQETREQIKTETGHYGHFYNKLYLALTGAADLMVKPEQSADVIRMIEAAVLSHQEKRRISVPR